MSALEGFLSVHELGWEEMDIALDGLKDENVWKRPAPELLSVGETVGHAVTWNAICLAGAGPVDNPDLSRLLVTSQLIDPVFQFYPDNLAAGVPQHLTSMTAAELRAEAKRVSDFVIERIKKDCNDVNAPLPGWEDRPWKRMLRYMAFHVGYHAGQVYSARHLLGEETPDN